MSDYRTLEGFRGLDVHVFLLSFGAVQLLTFSLAFAIEALILKISALSRMKALILGARHKLETTIFQRALAFPVNHRVRA